MPLNNQLKNTLLQPSLICGTSQWQTKLCRQMTYLWANYFLLLEVLNLCATESLSCDWTNQTGGLLSSERGKSAARKIFRSLSLREVGTASLSLSCCLFVCLFWVFLHYSLLSFSLILTFDFLHLISFLLLLYSLSLSYLFTLTAFFLSNLPFSLIYFPLLFVPLLLRFFYSCSFLFPLYSKLCISHVFHVSLFAYFHLFPFHSVNY